MQFPEHGTIYSVNEGNYIHFPQGIKNYIKYCQMEEGDRPYTSRYIGSLVSDFHRNMIKGGIYLYPTSSKNPNGKLRLLYECNPMAFIAEQANGNASDGFSELWISPQQSCTNACHLFVAVSAWWTKSKNLCVTPKVLKYLILR